MLSNNIEAVVPANKFISISPSSKFPGQPSMKLIKSLGIHILNPKANH